MMGGGSIFQERTDKLVKELLDKIRRENYSEEEKQPQEFDKESIRELEWRLNVRVESESEDDEEV